MSEAYEAKRIGADLQRNSGRGKFVKGDATWGPFVVDHKESKKSFTLNKRVWGKVCTDTMRVNSEGYPSLQLTIGEGNDKIRLWVIDDGTMQWMKECLENWTNSTG